MDINKNLAALMEEAQKMQKQMQDAQEELTKLIVTGEAGGGWVKVQMNGRHEVIDLEINLKLMDDDVDMLKDLLIAGINDAVQKIEKVSKDKINQLTAGLKIPKDLLEGEND